MKRGNIEKDVGSTGRGYERDRNKQDGKQRKCKPEVACSYKHADDKPEAKVWVFGSANRALLSVQFTVNSKHEQMDVGLLPRCKESCSVCRSGWKVEPQSKRKKDSDNEKCLSLIKAGPQQDGSAPWDRKHTHTHCSFEAEKYGPWQLTAVTDAIKEQIYLL